MTVTTYQSPAGYRLHLTSQQAAELTAWNAWPSDPVGNNYQQAGDESHGFPSLSGLQLATVCCQVKRDGMA